MTHSPHSNLDAEQIRRLSEQVTELEEQLETVRRDYEIAELGCQQLEGINRELQEQLEAAGREEQFQFARAERGFAIVRELQEQLEAALDREAGTSDALDEMRRNRDGLKETIDFLWRYPEVRKLWPSVSIPATVPSGTERYPRFVDRTTGREAALNLDTGKWELAEPDPANKQDVFRNDSGNGELTYEQVLERIALTVKQALDTGAFAGTLFETQVRGSLWLIEDSLPANKPDVSEPGGVDASARATAPDGGGKGESLLAVPSTLPGSETSAPAKEHNAVCTCGADLPWEFIHAPACPASRQDSA